MKSRKPALILAASAALNGICAETNSATASAPAAAANGTSYAPAILPGNGLAQHPFVYTGEYDFRNTDQTIFVVRGGKVVWTYGIPIKAADGTLQELGDATMLSNGNIVFCRKIGASEITPDKRIIWNMDAPKGTEIHSIQPIGLDHVLVTQNGNPARLMLINTVTGNTEKEFTFPDIGTGCGILISTTFPTSDEDRKVDNNFSGTTLVRNCELLRCGGYDYDWAWRGSLQICMDRRSISGLTVSHVTIQDSISSGVTIVAPGSPKGEGTLSDAKFETVNIINSGIGGSAHHDLWIRRDAVGSVALRNSAIADIRNESDHFSLLGP
jgi:hypothetical protein